MQVKKSRGYTVRWAVGWVGKPMEPQRETSIGEKPINGKNLLAVGEFRDGSDKVS
jgi:hypothetical protein